MEGLVVTDATYDHTTATATATVTVTVTEAEGTRT